MGITPTLGVKGDQRNEDVVKNQMVHYDTLLLAWGYCLLSKGDE